MKRTVAQKSRSEPNYEFGNSLPLIGINLSIIICLRNNTETFKHETLNECVLKKIEKHSKVCPNFVSSEFLVS